MLKIRKNIKTIKILRSHRMVTNFIPIPIGLIWWIYINIVSIFGMEKRRYYDKTYKLIKVDGNKIIIYIRWFFK